MEYITEFLSSYPSHTILIGYSTLLFLTLLGVAPSNSDMVIIAGVILTFTESVELYQIIIICFVLMVVVESSVYLVGYRWGNKILAHKFIVKIFSKEKQERFKIYANTNPHKLITTIRVTPLLRAYFTLLLGAIKLKPSEFFPRHAITSAIYLAIIIPGTYYFGQFIQELPPHIMKTVIGVAFIVWLFFMTKMKRDFKNSL